MEKCEFNTPFLIPCQNPPILQAFPSLCVHRVGNSINAQTYPGNSLSLSHPVFALNEKLKHAAYSSSRVAKYRRCPWEPYADPCCSFTLEEVSKLDRDTSVALANIREWRTSFIPVNRVPFDILSIFPTHLSSHRDPPRTSFLCCHGAGPSLSVLIYGPSYSPRKARATSRPSPNVQRLPLDVIVDIWTSEDEMISLSSYDNQIKYLSFVYAEWSDVKLLSSFNIQSWTAPAPAYTHNRHW